MRACRRRVAAGELVEPFPRLFARRAYWEKVKSWVRPYQIVRSLSRLHPRWVFSSFSAASIWGLSVSLELLDEVHLAVPRSMHAGARGGVIRHARKEIDTCAVMGVRVTSFEQTVVDCLLAAPFPEGLAIADSALRMRGMSQQALCELVERLGAHRLGVSSARLIAKHADARAESGGESIARGVMIEEGFVVPDLQTVLPNVLDPSAPFRVDGSWVLPDGRILVFEFDGKDKYERFAHRYARNGRGGAVERMMYERQREALLTAACDAVIRFGWETVKRPGALAHLLDSYGVPRV